MRRKAVRKTAVGVSLFPFLAVLICTMGALIVLLVLVVQQARVHAETLADQPLPEDTAERAERIRKLKEAESDQNWRLEILTQKREEKTAEVANSRNELSYLEQNIRELHERAELLRAEAEELKRLAESKSEDQGTARQRLAAKQAEIERAKKDLDKARQELASRPPAFAIIPYEGTNGTTRRPIYLECTGDALILQPEGVRLTPEDFAGPMTPGNPLDAALRAIREYWARFEVAGQSASPYPLLIVRPKGVMAYSKARSAMQGWDDEFGYELIDDKMTLTFPPADPKLAEVVEKAIADARRRQQALLATIPKQYRSRGGGAGGLVASSTGGFVPVDGFPRDSGRSNGSGGGWDAPGFGERSSRDARMGGDALNEAGMGIGEFGSAHSRDGSGDGTGDGAGSGNRDQSGADGASGSPSSAKGGNSGGPPSGSTSANGFAGGVPGGTAPGGSMSGSPGSPGSSAGDGASSGVNSVSNTGQMPPASLAQKRGENWGLPNAAQGLVGVTRPLIVAVLPDRLVLLPNRTENWTPVITPISGPMQSSVDEFVSHIWKHVKNWGIAVPGGYWKPVLVVEVLPGGEARFEEMQALLRDSGLEIQRKAN